MYTVYSKSGCVYCTRAKDTLDLLGEDFVDIRIDEPADTLFEKKAEMNTKLGYEARTVPQIWHGDVYVGGYDDLVKYLG